jgi:hypothetical protein
VQQLVRACKYIPVSSAQGEIRATARYTTRRSRRCRTGVTVPRSVQNTSEIGTTADRLHLRLNALGEGSSYSKKGGGEGSHNN